jgi:uncharacterized membrane protein
VPGVVSTYQWLLSLHVLFAFGLLSTSLTVHALYLAARRRGRRPAEVLPLLGTMRRVAPVIGPFGLLTLAFGIWLVLEVGYDWGDIWIVLSLVLFAIGMIGGPLLGASLAPAGMLAGKLAAQGAGETDEVSRALTTSRIVVLAVATGLAPLAILALMIFKPGLG